MKPSLLQTSPRHLWLTMVFAVLVLVLTIMSSTLGKHQILLTKLFDLLFGQTDAVSHWLFWQLWLPRTLVAVGVGASLAVSGCLFQVLSRNPLGSPDIIGINAGAAAGAVSVSLIWVNSLPMTVGAILGALLTLLLVLLSHGKTAQGRLNMVIAGLAVNALAMAWVQFALTGVRQEDAYQMSVWLNGSLAQRGWQEVMLIWLVLPICLIWLILLRRPLAMMQLSPQTAMSLGISPSRLTVMSLLPATILATASVVAAGPIAFIALAAPHLTRQLFRSHYPMMLPTALVGASLLLVADLLARWVNVGGALPVGVWTAGLGGVYLLYLIVKEK